MEFKDFDKLSDAAKMEAMRAGNCLVVSLPDMADFVSRMSRFLETGGEFLSIERIGTLHEDLKIFSVTIGAVLKTRAVEDE